MLKLASAIIIPAFAIGFVVGERTGIWDRMLGLDLVLQLAADMETSYREDAVRQIRPGDPKWQPTIALVKRYSSAQLPEDREPVFLGRFRATSSAKLDIAPGVVSEWTAPSTPMVLAYKDPDRGAVSTSDYRLVGGVGDLRRWVDQRRADLRFVVLDVFVAVIALSVGTLLWIRERRSE